MPDAPAISPANTVDAVGIVRDWARAALEIEAGRSSSPRPAVPGAALVEAVRRHRIAELIAPHAAALGAAPEVSATIARLRDGGRRMLMVQILETGRVHRLLSEEGIGCLVFKGPALAVQSAGDPAARGPGDIDLLISPDRVVDAHSALVAHGWSPRPTSAVLPGTWAWRHAVRSFHAFTYDGPGGISVDLHWRLDPTLEGLPGFDEVWSRHVVVDLGGGVRVPTLSTSDAMAHSCLHAAKDSWRWLRSLVDLHRLARQDDTWSGLRDRPLRRLELTSLAVTRWAVGLPDVVPSPVLGRLDGVPPSALRRARASQERPVVRSNPFPGAESVRQLRYLVAASPTPRDVAHSAVGMMLPVTTVVGVEARSAWAGVPLTLLGRLGRAWRRALGWARHRHNVPTGE